MRLLTIPVLLSLSVVLPVLSYAQAQNEARKLVICGGGSLPDSIINQFRELAGTDPKLVVIPTASKREYGLPEAKELWGKRGFKQVDILHFQNRKETLEDAELSVLRNATAIWFGGGSQQRLADIYLGTEVENELIKLADNGVVIGGTSAGAAIQSKVMIAGGRGKPELSQGFDLLKNAIIDQHFLRRNRLSRLKQAVRSNPTLTGFGIDESTALILNKGKLKVVGRSYVIRIRVSHGDVQHDSFEDGEAIDLPGQR